MARSFPLAVRPRHARRPRARRLAEAPRREPIRCLPLATPPGDDDHVPQRPDERVSRAGTPAYRRRVEGRAHLAPAVRAAPLADRHHPSPQPPGGRRPIRLPESLPGALPAHVPHHRGIELPRNRVLPAEAAADGQCRMEHEVSLGGRVRPVRRQPHVAVPRLALPETTRALRSVPDVPRGPGRGNPTVARGVPALPPEAHLEIWPSAHPQVSPAHLPDPPPARHVPGGPLRAYPSRPVRRLLVEPEDVPGQQRDE